jgi:hypothetical protein
MIIATVCGDERGGGSGCGTIRIDEETKLQKRLRFTEHEWTNAIDRAFSRDLTL